MLIDRYSSQIRGSLSCFDRILIMGTLPDICHARAFTRELSRRGVRIFDFTKFTQPSATGSGTTPKLWQRSTD